MNDISVAKPNRDGRPRMKKETVIDVAGLTPDAAKWSRIFDFLVVGAVVTLFMGAMPDYVFWYLVMPTGPETMDLNIGMGYPASTQVLGAQQIEINARPGVLLVLPADTPADLAVFAVALNCSAADTGLLASTQVPRP